MLKKMLKKLKKEEVKSLNVFIRKDLKVWFDRFCYDRNESKRDGLTYILETHKKKEESK